DWLTVSPNVYPNLSIAVQKMYVNGGIGSFWSFPNIDCIHAANMAYYSEAPSTSGFPFPGRQDPTFGVDESKMMERLWGESCNTLKSEHAAECLNIRERYIIGSIAQDLRTTTKRVV
ncbi:hypothetical protein Tco_0633491, partial [Tanacetum coccineum]